MRVQITHLNTPHEVLSHPHTLKNLPGLFRDLKDKPQVERSGLRFASEIRKEGVVPLTQRLSRSHFLLTPLFLVQPPPQHVSPPLSKGQLKLGRKKKKTSNSSIQCLSQKVCSEPLTTSKLQKLLATGSSPNNLFSN